MLSLHATEFPSDNVLARGLRNYRWAASARCWRWRRGAAAAVRAFDRHGDARIGDGDAIPVHWHQQRSTTSPNATAEVRFGLWRSCDGQFLRLAETAGKAEARWRNVDRESRRNRSACSRPACGRCERISHGARPSAVRRALHVPHRRDVQGLGIPARIRIRIDVMLRGLIHHQAGESGLGQVNPVRCRRRLHPMELFHLPWCRH